MTGIADLVIIILIAAVLSVIFHFLKQPLLLALIITGVIIGHFGLLNLNNQETLKTFSDLGLMFLLFLVGMEIDYTSLKIVGRSALTIGVFQIVFTAALGYLTAVLLHIDPLASLYIAAALTFSSTVIVVKLLSEKKDLNSLYGKIDTGILLLQDFAAILILVFLAGFAARNHITPTTITLMTLKGIVLSLLTVFIGAKIIPRLFNKIAKSQELLFLVSLAWAFLIVASAQKIGLSLEIGGFLAGLSLANSSERYQISGQVKSLRDFFILIFFITLGSSLVFSQLQALIVPVLIFSLFTLIGKPLIIFVIMGIMGYRKHTTFMSGLTLAQISEFSFVLAALGLKIGHISAATASLITATGVLSFILFTYFSLYDDKIYSLLSRSLVIFERRKTKENSYPLRYFEKPIVLIGAHRLGQSIAFSLEKEDVLIVDFDPDVIHQLKNNHHDYLFGDISDEEIIEKSGLEKAKLVISTAPNFRDNLHLLEKIKNYRQQGSGIKIVVRARNEWEIPRLYKAGADYVILPHFTAGYYLGKSIAIDPEMKIFDRLREHDVEILKKIKEELY